MDRSVLLRLGRCVQIIGGQLTSVSFLRFILQQLSLLLCYVCGRVFLENTKVVRCQRCQKGALRASGTFGTPSVSVYGESPALLWERRGECPGAEPVLACHDEIVVECSAEQAVDAKAWLEKAMIEGMDTVLNSTDEVYVPVEVDAWIARSWGKEVSLMFRRALANSVLETIGSLQDALTQVLEPNWAEPARL